MSGDKLRAPRSAVIDVMRRFRAESAVLDKSGAKIARRQRRMHSDDQPTTPALGAVRQANSERFGFFD